MTRTEKRAAWEDLKTALRPHLTAMQYYGLCSRMWWGWARHWTRYHDPDGGAYDEKVPLSDEARRALRSLNRRAETDEMEPEVQRRLIAAARYKPGRPGVYTAEIEKVARLVATGERVGTAARKVNPAKATALGTAFRRKQ
jgi:hypothetical protein